MRLVFRGCQVHRDKFLDLAELVYNGVSVHKQAGSCLFQAVMVDQVVEQGIFQISLVLYVITVEIYDRRMTQEHNAFRAAVIARVLDAEVRDQHRTVIAIVDDPGF